ncbi:PAS domain-containing hybrid sensor histidine kinase/response regulator [Oceanobacter sp. 4_MG-2023]|uniref:PAS domain-containing hybrid sensor histidine kinase/response regulator n=3 Tax=Gammaproteobacteria TaxID=1236 RepID=UPI0027357DAA|nr:PAS domain-containing hybrid sensor histidine kinase/response regulator [Oceanobacter sp. 4_MG-2023]MDP2548411.1 PAS domain-containing hybrid sensor histidine kinase/response regulator [Oceanobacter sp. 4_MG-2023]
MDSLIHQVWFVGGLSLMYVGFLFVIAIWGSHWMRPSWQPYVYSLTLAIFCTSWAFYGTVQQALTHGWILAPTYTGAIILITIGWKVMDRIIQIARQENSTTISDFISARFGHSRGVGILVALLCLLGVVPYIALQLKAVSASFQLVTLTSSVELRWFSDPTLIIAGIMAVFSILFGTRTVDSSESHQGMMLAIAFESLVKLVALMAVGLFAVYGLYDGFADLVSTAMADPLIAQTLTDYADPSVYLTHALLGAIAIIALPRHFHVAVVEYRSQRDIRAARWMFPLYLLAINLFLLPLGLAATLNQDMLESFTYITLELPLAFQQEWLALLAYIGGLSAGTSMVIISSITLATMVCNEIVLPILIRLGWQGNGTGIKSRVLLIRRVAIVGVLALAFVYYRLLSQFHNLSEIGLLAFVAIAQFAPAILIGMIWHGANRMGAYWGIGTGFAVWSYTLFLPVASSMGWGDPSLLDGPWGLAFLQPHGLLGLGELNPIVHGTFWSLMLNTLMLVIASLYHKPSFADTEQAQRFVYSTASSAPINTRRYAIHAQDLRALLQRFINPAKVSAFFEDFSNPLTGRILHRGEVDEAMLKEADRLLSSVVGRKGSALLLRNLVEDGTGQYTTLNNLVEEVSEVVLFNRDLLNSILHSLNQGITVVDEHLTLVAWNQSFASLYGFPQGHLYVGQSAEALLGHIARSGGYGDQDVDAIVAQRFKELRQREKLHYVRKTRDGRSIELSGTPIGDSLYITVYSDITEYRHIEEQLRSANEVLEQRVDERTHKLTELNHDLQKASRNKTRFLAAAGHDLVQPLNSASLFSASILNKLERRQLSSPGLVEEIMPVAQHLDQSLHSAESLLNELLEISKLDADIVRPRRQEFELDQMLDSLVEEFRPLAAQKGIELHYVRSRIGVDSDPVLLRRIIQNLLSNALRYTRTGRILVGSRRRQQQVLIQVLDTGIGIPAHELDMIFEEFHRLAAERTGADTDMHTPANTKGLGLGLSIVRRLCLLLDHPIQVISEPGRGSCFSVSIPTTIAPLASITPEENTQNTRGSGLILCVDNEQQIIDGMAMLLGDWGYQVVTASSFNRARKALAGEIPDLVIIDYHLDQGVTGLDVMAGFSQVWQQPVPCLVITADYTDEVKQGIEELGFMLLRKPVKPMALRALLHKML